MTKSRLSQTEQAIREHVADGDCVFIGGFGQCIPFALGAELIRQRKRGLTICKSGADILFDMLIAADCVERVIFGYIGNPGVGLAHAFRRYAESGRIAVEDWTNFSLILRLHAATLGVPFLPAATMLIGDTPGASATVSKITCPFTGEVLAAIPALKPDVALIHAQRADEAGNVQMWGLPGDSLEGALAADRIIATVEEIVPTREIEKAADRTVIPGFRVTAVCRSPLGAYPSYVEGFYGRDDSLYLDYDRIARDDASLAAFLDDAIFSRPSWEAFVRSRGSEVMEKLLRQARELRAGLKNQVLA